MGIVWVSGSKTLSPASVVIKNNKQTKTESYKSPPVPPHSLALPNSVHTMTLHPDSLGTAASEDKPGLSDKQSQEGKPAGFPVAPAAALPKPPM